MTTPADPVRDVIRRTLANYDFIKDHASAEVFEVTQLVNSFLCAVIQPWSDLKKSTHPWNLSLAAAELDGWPDVACRTGTTPTLGHLIIEIRNALSHGNVEYLASNGTDISGLRLTTKQPFDYTAIKWEAEFSIADLECFLAKFATIAIG
jgi:hypothetical protein